MKRDHAGDIMNERKFKQKMRTEIVDFDKAVKLKTSMHRYNNYVQEKQKLKQKRKQRINKGANKISGGLEALGGAVDSGIGLYQSIEAGDGIGVASSV